MNNIQIIDDHIREGRCREAIEALDALIAEQPENAHLRYLRGKAYWRLGMHGKAISDYEHASQLDPSSPATQALEMSRSIMDYFNPDLINP